MHKYLLSGMFVGVLLFFLVVSATPSHASPNAPIFESRRLYSRAVVFPPSTVVHATTVSHAVTPTPSPTVTSMPTSKPVSLPITASHSVTSTVASPASTPALPPTSAAKTTTAPAASSGSVQDTIMAGINKYRTSLGLSSVQTDSNTCNFARTRAGEIVGSFNHDGFTNRINSHTLPYSTYHEVTENIAMTSDYTQVVPMWIASPGHAENMRRDTPFVCVEQSGNYFAYEGWKP